MFHYYFIKMLEGTMNRGKQPQQHMAKSDYTGSNGIMAHINMDFIMYYHENKGEVLLFYQGERMAEPYSSQSPFPLLCYRHTNL